MVKEIKRKEIKSYVRGAIDISREKIESAADAYKRQNYGQVLSSLYYAYFHLIKALLYTKGFDPKTHEGVYSMLNLHFIRYNVIDKKFSRFFEKLHKSREIADYNPIAPKFDKRDANTFATEFTELTLELLNIFANFKKEKDIITRSIKELKGLIVIKR
jgi:hypothetical protein